MITVTEKTKNLNTEEKTKTQTKTEFMADWLNILNKWVETNCNDESTVYSRTRTGVIEFRTITDGVRHDLKIKWD